MAKNNKHEERLKQQSGAILQDMLKELAATKAFDVHFEEGDDDSYAVVKTNDYDEDTETALILLSQSRWILSLGYYNEKDDFIELFQPLSQTEIALIPNGLQKGMLKVLESEDGLRLPGVLLTK
ncbi:hypothetical protein HNQ91_002724 [Filimonas zeae]|uniref:Uncharacterized protein n=1 Tax=Filimonas zeae TaxID=1737353 RepID=A0A917IXU2_9BACT|nr:hypothetical protein [Filimonas zeae]MDR6339659.1 hypothetical protein [Filimonas zeae]GGH69019.1 hypothetical protein GCM10011379_25890 [Filimonas zeae]